MKSGLACCVGAMHQKKKRTRLGLEGRKKGLSRNKDAEAQECTSTCNPSDLKDNVIKSWEG